MKQDLPTFFQENKSKILRNLIFLVVFVIAYLLFDAFLAEQNEQEVRESEREIQAIRDKLKKEEADFNRNMNRRLP